MTALVRRLRGIFSTADEKLILATALVASSFFHTAYGCTKNGAGDSRHIVIYSSCSMLSINRSSCSSQSNERAT